MKLLSNDWQKSTAHVVLLLQFINPTEPVEGFNDQNWEFVLGEPLDRAVKRLRALNYIDTIPLATHLELMTVKELKQILTELNLSTSGNKLDLIQRLLNDADFNQLSVLAPRKKLVLTSFGEQFVKDYRDNKERIKRELDELPTKAEIAERTQEEPGPADGGRQRITKGWVRENLKWLSKEVLIASIVGGAAYDILKSYWPTASEAIQTGWKRLRTSQVTPAIRIEWCPVPAGEFWMGAAPHDKDAGEDEKPGHRLYLPALEMAKYPVTNALYQVYARESGLRGDALPYHWKNGKIPSGKSNHPVVYVSYKDAVAFCRWLSWKINSSVTLPTEAQWEKAARGTEQRIYPWGNLWRPDLCNHEGSGFYNTVAVDHYSKNISPYGCVGMAGNVLERTRSTFKAYPYVPTDGRENQEETDRKVLKGGHSYSIPKRCRISFRTGIIGNPINYSGLRVCISNYLDSDGDLTGVIAGNVN
ncbi:MAG: SUMF1/EgtB/PvdO family nonheme iron enzyme [Chloroflexota bacterium]